MSVRQAVRPAPRPPAVPLSARTPEEAVTTTHATAPRAITRRTVARKPSAATLVAAVAVQSCQAVLWLFAGLLMTIGYMGAHWNGPAKVNEPVAVVLIIAAILAFAVGAFVLALSVGVLGRSEVCRIASVIFQAVFGALTLAGSAEIIRERSAAGLRIALDPATGPEFLLTPTVVAAMLASCIAAASLLLCHQTAWATRVRYRRRYR